MEMPRLDASTVCATGRRRRAALPAALCLAALAACATTPDPEAVRRSFEMGQNLLPQEALREGQSRSLSEIRDHPGDWKTRVGATRLRPGVRLPAVIYLHGCAGNTLGYAWAGSFNRLGYAFFAPDSLARPRHSMCGSGRSAMISRRIPLRLEEMRYALAQIRDLDWIDPKRIVLMGSSEGAQAASAYGGDEFAAVVLIGTDCRFSGGSPRTPATIPVLNLVGSEDREGGGNGCELRRSVGGSRKTIIDGGFHKLGRHPAAQRELEDFLAACCAPAARNVGG